MASYSLVTLASYKTFAGITTATNDTVLQDLIDSMSLVIEARVGCQIVDRTVTEYASGGAKTMVLQNPIVSVTSIASPDGVTTVASTDYWFQPRSNSMRHGSRWPHAFSTGGVRADWLVTYVGGLMPQPSDDLRLACCKAVAWAFEKRASSPDVSSVSVGSMSVSYGGGVATASALPTEVELMIGKYVRTVIV